MGQGGHRVLPSIEAKKGKERVYKMNLSLMLGHLKNVMNGAKKRHLGCTDTP